MVVAMTTIRSSVVALPAHAELVSTVVASLDRINGAAPSILRHDASAGALSHCDAAIFVTAGDGVVATVAAISRLLAEAPSCSILVVGAGLDCNQELTLLGAGAADFVTLPCADDELKARLHRAIGRLPCEPPPADIRSLLDRRIKDVVGCSAAFLKPLSQLPTIAGCDASVLIYGETGTGKEVCAQAVHYLSARASRPWVAVNCGAIPADLVESELFGHVRGAFTGAHVARTGLVREAEGGTLFLDDVDCLPLEAQAKLLRFLQEREYRQVGANGITRADVRVIAASNQSLRQLGARGTFRQDLYFRLNVLVLRLPALRERRTDIAPLALHFMHGFAREFGRAASSLSPSALQKLLSYSWPGNVRELKHVIERAVLLGRAPILTAADIDIDVDGTPTGEPDVESFRAAKAKVVENFERGLIEHLLATHKGNVSSAARAAKKNRRAFFQLMRKYTIDAASYRDSHC